MNIWGDRATDGEIINLVWGERITEGEIVCWCAGLECEDNNEILCGVDEGWGDCELYCELEELKYGGAEIHGEHQFDDWEEISYDRGDDNCDELKLRMFLRIDLFPLN